MAPPPPFFIYLQLTSVNYFTSLPCRSTSNDIKKGFTNSSSTFTFVAPQCYSITMLSMDGFPLMMPLPFLGNNKDTSCEYGTSEWMWINVDENGWILWKWMNVDESGWKWMKVDENIRSVASISEAIFSLLIFKKLGYRSEGRELHWNITNP